MNSINKNNVNMKILEKYPMNKNDNDSNIIHTFFQDLKSKGNNIDSTIIMLKEFAKTNPETQYLNKNGSYILNNYHIVPGYVDIDAPFINNLKLIKHYGFCMTSAPELSDMHHIPQDNFGVLLFKVNDTKSVMMDRYVEVGRSIPEEKKLKFLQEQVMLMDNLGKYNPAIIDSYDSWLVTPDTKNIYIDTWSELKDCKSLQEKSSIKAKIKSRIL